MAGGAVGLLGVVGRRERGLCVAREAFGTEEGCAGGGRGLGVRVVTGSAGEGVSGGLSAGALEEGFVLARGAGSTGGLRCANEIKSDVAEAVAWDELGERAAGPVDHSISFEVALHAGAVAALR